MAKFANDTLIQVAGFDGQILAQEMVYDQKDFWNMTWSTKIGSAVTPVDLTGVTISAQIIRRQLSDVVDGRYGLEFQISDYPAYPLTWGTASGVFFSGSSSITNAYTITGTNPNLEVGDPVQFDGGVFGGVVANTTYYIKSLPTSMSFTLSETLGGPTFQLSTDTGSMYLMLPATYGPEPVNLTITNRINDQGKFTLVIDDDVWGVLATDPELNINATDPVGFSGRIKLSFPSAGSTPAYDEQIFLLFLIRSDGVVN